MSQKTVKAHLNQQHIHTTILKIARWTLSRMTFSSPRLKPFSSHMLPAITRCIPGQPSYSPRSHFGLVRQTSSRILLGASQTLATTSNPLQTSQRFHQLCRIRLRCQAGARPFRRRRTQCLPNPWTMRVGDTRSERKAKTTRSLAIAVLETANLHQLPLNDRQWLVIPDRGDGVPRQKLLQSRPTP